MAAAGDLDVGELAVTQPREIAVYAQEFEVLASSAVYGSAARELINTAIRTLSSKLKHVPGA